MMNTTQPTPLSMEVPLASLIELAIENWRLERWLAKLDQEEATAHGRHVSRQFNRFLSERELDVLDLTGQPYEPGLALEVLEVVEGEETPAGAEVIDETIIPIVTWRGTVVQFGQVVIRRRSDA